MRNTLNQGQRKQLIEEYLRRSNAGEPSSQNALAEWAAQTFNFAQKPSQATISRLLKNRVTISKSRTPDNAKRAAVPRQPALEDALFSWVVDQKVRRGRVTSGTVREFGRLLLRNVNERLPGGRHLEFRFSNGWMEKYKKRYGLKFWRLNEEPDDEQDANVFEEGYPAFVRKLSTFREEDVWTAAEFGVQYHMNADSNISTSLGQDESKMTVLACCNKSGSEKYPLTMIGKSSTKISIDERTTKDIDFEYISNVRAWMTAKLFFQWLHSFDAYIGRKRERKVLLVLDSCSAHGNHETVPALKHVEILFLPPASLAKTLPMECGVISTLKLRFKRHQLLSVLDGVDQGARNSFYVNPIVAMRWLSQEWSILPPIMIQSCWQQSLGNIDADRHKVLVESSREEAYEINELLNEVARVCGRVNIRSLLYSPDERDCIETVNLETLRDSVVDRLISEKIDSQTVSLPDVPSLPPVDEQLKALATVRQILDERGMIDKNLRTVVRDVQRAIRTELAAKTGRTTLFGFSGSNVLQQGAEEQRAQVAQHAQNVQSSHVQHPRLSQPLHEVQSSPATPPPQSSQSPQQPQQPRSPQSPHFSHSPQRTHSSEQSVQPQPIQLSPSSQAPQQPQKLHQSNQSQNSELSQQSQPSQQPSQTQQTQDSEKDQLTTSSVQVQDSATPAPLTRFSRARAHAKRTDISAHDKNKVPMEVTEAATVQVNASQPKVVHVNNDPPRDVPISVTDTESVVKDVESTTRTQLLDEDVQFGEQHPNISVPETERDASERPCQLEMDESSVQEHHVHDQEIRGITVEFKHSEVVPKDVQTESIEISEVPS